MYLQVLCISQATQMASRKKYQLVGLYDGNSVISLTYVGESENSRNVLV